MFGELSTLSAAHSVQLRRLRNIPPHVVTLSKPSTRAKVTSYLEARSQPQPHTLRAAPVELPAYTRTLYCCSPIARRRCDLPRTQRHTLFQRSPGVPSPPSESHAEQRKSGAPGRIGSCEGRKKLCDTTPKF